MFISLPQACCCLVLHPESGKLWSPASEHLLDLVHCQLFKVQAQSLQQHPEHPGKLPDTDKMAFFLGNPSPFAWVQRYCTRYLLENGSMSPLLRSLPWLSPSLVLLDCFLPLPGDFTLRCLHVRTHTQVEPCIS